MSKNLEFIKVSCDGTDLKAKSMKVNQNSKHPLIYIKVPYNKKVFCPYCGKEFFFNKEDGKNIA